MAPATTSTSIDNLAAVHESIIHAPAEAFDPLPDETVLKTGWLYKKGRRGSWKKRWFVLRSDRLAYYKDEKEYKTLKIIPALDINTATAIKSKKPFTFAIFTSSRTFTLSAPSEQETQEWINALLQASNFSTHRCEEELGLQPTSSILQKPQPSATTTPDPIVSLSRSPSNLPPLDTGVPSSAAAAHSLSSAIPFTGISPASRGHSSPDIPRVGSFESSGGYFSGTELGTSTNEQGLPVTPGIGPERTSIESDELEGLAEDRVVAQGYLLCLKNVSGVRQWRRRWVVLRGRSLTLYKNFEEYKPLRIIPLQSVLAAVDIDPLSRTKRHCFQIVTKEKVLRFCADSEAEVDKWLGGLVSLIEGKGVGQGLGGAKA